MKGLELGKKGIVVTAAAILTITSISAGNPYRVYGQDGKSITIEGTTMEILNSSSDKSSQENHWTMKIDNQTGKDILFYDLKKGDQVITKKQAFKGDSLVVDIEDYDGEAVYTIDVYGIDKSIKASAKLYQVQADLEGSEDESVALANGVVTEAEESDSYEASASCVVDDTDYDLDGSGVVEINYSDMEASSGYTVSYKEHDGQSNGKVYKAGVQLTDDSGNVFNSTDITYYGTYTYQAPRTFSRTSTDENGNNVVTYYRATDEKAQAVLTKEDNGKTVKIAYSEIDSQTPYDWNINIIDLMTGKTLDTVTKQIGVDQSQSYEAKETFEKDGVTYTLDSSMETSYTHQYGDKERTTNIYYYDKENWDPENGYDITVKYVNIADQSEIASQTLSVTNEQDTEISCPEEYQSGNHTYIRLKGQSDTLRHSYYSNIRQYTIYYRDSNDTINADAEITYVVVDGGEITVDDVIYRVVPGTTVATVVNPGTTGTTTGDGSGTTTGTTTGDGSGTTTGNATGDGTGTTTGTATGDGTTTASNDTASITTVLGDGNTEGVTSEVVENADDQVPLANENLDNNESSSKFASRAMVTVAGIIVALLVLFGIYLVAKKRNEKRR